MEGWGCIRHPTVIMSMCLKKALLHVCMLAQAARLLVAFREFKRRESVGLVPYYANKLAALEEALLGCRYGGRGTGGSRATAH